MNYGYYKDGFHPLLKSFDERERYPIQLYHHVASQINLEGKTNVVISDRLLYSSLAYQYKNEKFKLLMPLSDNQKITKHFQIKSSLKKQMYDRFLFIGDSSEISYLENVPSVKLLKKTNPKFISTTIKIYEVTF